VLPNLQYAAIRYENFHSEVLLPQVFPLREPIWVSMWQAPGTGLRSAHPDLAEAKRAKYRRVEVGLRWGPVWSTAWFRLSGRLPAAMRGHTVALRFSCGTEATLWRDGVPFQGFDPYRDLAFLWPSAKGGEKVDLLVEGACNLPLGISTFWWDHPELQTRWREPNPGRLESAELVVVDEAAWRYAQAWDFLRRLMLALPEDSARATEIANGLRDIHTSIDARDPVPGMEETASALDELVRGGAHEPSTACVAVGHAHIDTAWLWPLRETRRKCVRSFANVLRLQERFPNFHFLCSQAQQYAYVKEDAPELYAQIARRVKEGRWEAGGAMWIEPDCTCPSGESFVRQIVHGTGFWTREFCAAGRQRFLYLPDTFGFPPCLPQIARLGGLDTFITNKMSWCETNRFPHVTFMWRGLDGSELLTHLTPGHNYNSSIEPKDMLYGEKNLVVQDGQSFFSSAIPMWLQPFGFGDGGGGPTDWQIARAELASDCAGLPRFEQHRVDVFCGRLHAGNDALEAAGRPVARWDGELYLELHRGTYTSQAWLKRQNRLAESALREVEALASSLPTAKQKELAALRGRLDGAWKTVLLNQFHDILPGSSIDAVYEDARRDHVAVAETAGAERARLEKAFASLADTRGMKRPVLVRNPASTKRCGVVEVDGALVEVRDVPALGVRVVDAAAIGALPEAVEVKASARGVVLSNGVLRASIDLAGRIGELAHLPTRRVANMRDARGRALPLNQLALYEDRPRRWEAWDTDRDYMDKVELVEGDCEIAVVEAHPLRGEVRVERALGERSRIWQTYRLDAASGRLEVRVEVDWQESQRLLRALFPCAVRARHAWFGTQFGAIERPIHRNTSWEEARFEVPGHAWMDASEPGFGVAILDDGRYGRSALASGDGATLGLSLLKSPLFPDPGCDRGEHSFAYAVMPHGGDWRDAGVDHAADCLREPMRAIPLAKGAKGALHGAWAPFEVLAAAPMRVETSAWKPAEDGRGRILRIVETRGARGDVQVFWNVPATKVSATDLLERPLARPDLVHAKGAATLLRMKPFEIVTLRVE
ncbi:MAG: alpha-mannosidase, partial [Planctomycetota bacterium]